MRRSTETYPRRAGPLYTPATATSLPGTTHPATTKKADAEGSPGTVRETGSRLDALTRTTLPSPQGSTVMSAPASASISSVWVRVVTGSRTTVVPLAESPARRMADFTWALAILAVQSMPCSRPPRTRRGGKHLPPDHSPRRPSE